MKRCLFLVCVALFCVLPVVVHAENIFYRASGTTTTAITFKTMVQAFSVLAPDADVTVYAYVGTTAVDTINVLAGRSMFLYCPCNNLSITRTTATAVYVNPTYDPRINPILGSSSTSSVPAADYVTVTDGYHTGAASSFAFLPLIPVGSHNLIGFQVSYAGADTLWAEVLCSNSMMDSLTAFDFGTSAAHVYSKRLIRTVMGGTETSPSGFTAGVSAYASTAPFSFMVRDANGYPGLPKFVGIRIRAGTVAPTSIKIVAVLGNMVGGE